MNLDFTRLQREDETKLPKVQETPLDRMHRYMTRLPVCRETSTGAIHRGLESRC